MKAKLVKYFSVFLSGFLLMLTISIFNDWTYEREMLVNLREHVYSKCKKRDITTIVDTALHYTHMLQDPATVVYANKNFSTLKQFIAPSSFRNYYFGKDACGAYAAFFSRLMASAGYRARILQLNLDDRKAGHMAVCIAYEGKQYLVDPYSNHVFKDSTGHISDVNDVAKNWYSYYSHYLPSSYPKYYNYQYGWSFTNWDKFGWFSRGIYKMSCTIFGKQKVDRFSFHSYLMGSNKFYLLSAFGSFLVMFYYSIRLNFGYGVRKYLRIQFSKRFMK